MTKSNLPVIPPFNPLDKRNIGESAAKALLSSSLQDVPPSPFIGAGVYAIYYFGNSPIYSSLHLKEKNCPIYVGKAVPAGARKGNLGLEINHGTALFKRLAEHAESISVAQNLELKDFKCRFLVVDDIWIPLTESLLIEQFQPVWNCLIDGFGNHDPGSGRYNQQKSPWDNLHPGRSWANKLKSCAYSVAELVTKVKNYKP